MTGNAVRRNLARAVAAEAETHVDLYCFNRNTHLRQVPMTGGAIDTGMDVWSMVKLHMSRRGETVYPFPGHIPASVEISCQLSNFRAVVCQQLVAAHTKFVTRDASHRTAFHPGMAHRALNALCQVFIVCKRDRLDGGCAPSEELAKRILKSEVLRGKDLTSHVRRITASR